MRKATTKPADQAPIRFTDLVPREAVRGGRRAKLIFGTLTMPPPAPRANRQAAP